MRTITGTGAILEAHRRYRELNEEVGPVAAQSWSIRAGLVDRHGEVRNARDAWERDPAHADLMRLIDQSDSLCAQLTAATDTIVTTPATTLRGLSVKLQVALDVWPKGDEEELDYHDVAAAAVMRDAVRLLAEMLAQPADPAPDAGLLNLCAEFHRLHADAAAVSDDDDLAAALRRRWDVSDRIEGMRPITGAGQSAKAAIALFLLEENRGSDPVDADARFAVATLRDLAGGAVQVAEPHPEAELLAVCREFLDAEKDMRAAYPADGGDDDEEEDEDASKALFRRWYGALDRVTELRATTAEGIRAKAEAAHAAMMSVRDELHGEECAGLAVLADILAGAVA